MKSIYAISLLSFKEGIRQRILYGVLIFALGVAPFSVLISGLFMRDISKVILDFCLSAINIGGLLVPFFLAVDMLSKDLERKTIYSLLAQPISRNKYILGKFGGLLLLTGLIMLFLTIATFFSIWGGKLLYGERFFQNFSLQAVSLSILFSWLGIIVFESIVILWCCITTNSFLATLLTLATYVIGQSIDDIVRFLSIDTPGLTFSAGIRKTILIAQYLFPNLSAFDFKLQAAHGIIPHTGDMILIASYGLTYICCILILSMLIFRNRDLV